MPTSIVRARHLIARPDLVIDDGALLQRGGVIEAVGRWDEVRRTAPDAEVIGGPDYAAMPGLVNAHHHGRGLGAFFGGQADDALERWLLRIPAQRPGLDARLGALVSALQMVRSGTTTVLHNHLGPGVLDAVGALRRRWDARRLLFGLHRARLLRLRRRGVPRLAPRRACGAGAGSASAAAQPRRLLRVGGRAGVGGGGGDGRARAGDGKPRGPLLGRRRFPNALPRRGVAPGHRRPYAPVGDTAPARRRPADVRRLRRRAPSAVGPAGPGTCPSPTAYGRTSGTSRCWRSTARPCATAPAPTCGSATAARLWRRWSARACPWR